MENVVEYVPTMNENPVEENPLRAVHQFRYSVQNDTAALYATLVWDTESKTVHIATITIPSKVRDSGTELLRKMLDFLRTMRLTAITVTMQPSGAMMRIYTDLGFKPTVGDIWRLDL